MIILGLSIAVHVLCNPDSCYYHRWFFKSVCNITEPHNHLFSRFLVLYSIIKITECIVIILSFCCLSLSLLHVLTRARSSLNEDTCDGCIGSILMRFDRGRIRCLTWVQFCFFSVFNVIALFHIFAFDFICLYMVKKPKPLCVFRSLWKNKLLRFGRFEFQLPSEVRTPTMSWHIHC